MPIGNWGNRYCGGKDQGFHLDLLPPILYSIYVKFTVHFGWMLKPATPYTVKLLRHKGRCTCSFLAMCSVMSEVDASQSSKALAYVMLTSGAMTSTGH